MIDNLDVKALRAKFDNHEMILPEEFSDLLTRLEQAEQAVQRARELAEGLLYPGDYPNERDKAEDRIGRSILSVLDGDGRG